mmetsp:Transcript_21613/g.50209  ORF Transcript_21613/g.50209 Transcript_21613/m.50209 type:complete len:229 (+) Transcript_21613:53-739(+)
MGCCLERFRFEEAPPALRHVVMFTFKEHALAADEIAVLKAMNSLPMLVPQILRSTVGSDLRLSRGQKHPAGKNRSMVWLVDFRSTSDFEAFQKHPAHAELLAKFASAIEPESYAAIQYANPATLQPGVHHVVMFTLKEGATSEQFDTFSAATVALREKIKEIRNFAVVPDLRLEAGVGKNRSLAVLGEYASIEDYQVYETHPEHLAVIEQYIKPLSQPGSRAAIQYVL